MEHQDAQLAQLQRDVEAAADVVRARWSAFAAGAEAHVRTYLRDQATTTVTEQQSVAVDVEGGVAAFRDKVYALIDDIAAKAGEHFRGIPEEQVFKGWTWQHDNVGDRIVLPFGELFHEHGFSGGSTPNHPGIKASWYFYRPDTFGDGLTRGSAGMPHDHEKLNAYSAALQTLREAEQAVEARKAELDRLNVLDTWNNG